MLRPNQLTTAEVDARGCRSICARPLLTILGWVLVLVGVAALVLPGPGLLLLLAGLVVLSQEYEWAERRVEPVKDEGVRGRQGRRLDHARGS